jgi:hypothetical protein
MTANVQHDVSIGAHATPIHIYRTITANDVDEAGALLLDIYFDGTHLGYSLAPDDGRTRIKRVAHTIPGPDVYRWPRPTKH